MTIKTLKSLVCLAACISLRNTAWGWGATGHQVVAQIAYNHLDPAVKAKCDALIALSPPCGTVSHTFVSDSTWADQRCEAGTSGYHYIDLPISLDGYHTNGATIGVSNVVTALNQYIATLQNTNAALAAQATALRYVIHFTGDITQPCHSSNGITTNNFPDGDGGGNSFSLGHGSLHSFWDGGAGVLTNVSAVVAEVEALYPYTPNIGTVPDPMTWATDTYYYAANSAYFYTNGAGVFTELINGAVPDSTYTNQARATTKLQMAKGGKRLADLLNTIFAANAASFTANPTNGVAPLTVTFTDTSTGSITNRFWNFGDGSTTNFTASTNPTHTYAAGTYNVTLIDSASGISNTNAKPNYITATPSCTAPTASVSGGQTICQGGSATIQASLTGTGSWNVTWLDGAGGTNYLQNGVAASPATRSVSPSSTTTYTVTAVSDASGCSGGTSSGSAIVTVNPIPATPSPSNNGPICSGGTLTLSTPTVPGATYSWTGPGSFSSSLQNPSIANATPAASGTYSVTVTVNGCTSAAGSTSATVNAIPATPTAGNNGPILAGNTLNLTASTVSGGTYNWTGPNNFSSTQQNPSIANTTTAAAGDYSVSVTVNGCTSVAGSTTVLVTAPPHITSISPRGSDIVITWATTGGTTNTVQATPGNPDSTNFVDITPPLFILGSGDTSTNYVDFGAATNSPVMYYRVRLMP